MFEVNRLPCQPGSSLAGCRHGIPFISRHAFRGVAAEALLHALAGNLTPLHSHN
ncbi:MAG TPA: hypothetical protein VN890_06520 [Methylocella sp.]|nr:hypothetical protein [Methylocella sp.]